MRRNNYGFTLLELMIVFAIIGILLILALPTYMSYTTKSRRADAFSAILNIQLAEERFRANNSQYGSLAQLGIATTSAQGYYVLSTSNLSATSYTISATGGAQQANDAEGSVSCTTLTLTMTQGTTTQTPSVCWPS